MTARSFFLPLSHFSISRTIKILESAFSLYNGNFFCYFLFCLVKQQAKKNLLVERRKQGEQETLSVQ
jgi:hypothetical protein